MIQQCNYKLMFVTLALAFSLLGCESEQSEINSPGAGDNWIFSKFSGDNQSLELHDTLTQRLTVQLKMLNGTPIKNESILFKLVEGSGNVFKPTVGNDYLDLKTITDFEGKASAQFLNFGDSNVVSKVQAEVLSDSSLMVVFTINSI
ncbi:MAG: hypothetical protein IIA17_02245 [candidate division Zixibacteria bacterium]|nr:hypothetical protein [candidate division Zixibacteria bacterium]